MISGLGAPGGPESLSSRIHGISQHLSTWEEICGHRHIIKWCLVQARAPFWPVMPYPWRPWELGSRIHPTLKMD